MMDYKEDFDISILKQIEENLNKVENSHIKYGWLKKSLHKIHGIQREVPTAQIVFWNEFGTRSKDGKSHIPSRPYLTVTSISMQTFAVPYVEKFFIDNLSNHPFNQSALNSLGVTIKKEFNLTRGMGKDLAKSTIAKKKNSEHWIETGQLLDEFQVEKYNKKLLES